jgi:branched-chain amino acid aminotransferase
MSETPPWPSGAAWIDGRYCPVEDARISVLDLGVTREAGQPVDEGLLTAADLLRADEVLVTSTAGGIMPVTAVDGVPVGTGQPGPLTRQLRDRYWASHADPRYSAPVRYDEPAR